MDKKIWIFQVLQDKTSVSYKTALQEYVWFDLGIQMQFDLVFKDKMWMCWFDHPTNMERVNVLWYGHSTYWVNLLYMVLLAIEVFRLFFIVQIWIIFLYWFGLKILHVIVNAIIIIKWLIRSMEMV